MAAGIVNTFTSTSGHGMNRGNKLFTAILVMFEHVETGTGGRQQHGISRLSYRQCALDPSTSERAVIF